MAKRRLAIILFFLVLLGLLLIFQFVINKPNNKSFIKLNYGNGIITNYEFKEGLVFGDLPVETKEGYFFVGWSLDSNGTQMVSLNEAIKGQGW